MSPARAPEPAVASDWTPVDPFPALGRRRSFISGEPTGDRLRLAYFRRPGDPILYAKAWFGPGAEGPPDIAHGGAIFGVLDEVMGGCCWLSGLHVVAARLCTDFKHVVPLGLDTTCEGWIEEVNGRKVTARARMYDDAGAVLAESDGLFIVLEAAQFAEMKNRLEQR